MNRRNAFLQRKLGMAALGDYAPKFSVALGRSGIARDDYVVDLPFKRSVPLILIAAVFLAAFSVPLFTMGEFFAGSGDDSLFSLVFTLFSAFWMLGWSSGVALLLLLFLCLVMGRETLQASHNKLIIRIGIPGIALGLNYNAELIRNIRPIETSLNEAKKWRGQHIVFDYCGVDVGVGSGIGGAKAQEIISRLQGYLPLHDAEPLEFDLPPPVVIAAASDRDESAIRREVSSPKAQEPLRWYSLSAVALIGANLIPLAGVLLAGWDIGEIMLLFWAESAIIGYYNLCKMRLVGGWSVLFYGPFFIGHYGAFMVVHLLFIYAFFGGDIAGGADVSRMQVLKDMLALWPAFLGLLISHSISYYRNFVIVEKFKHRTMAYQMQEPYRRIIIMHLTIIFGGFLTLALGNGVGALLLLLGLKIAADLRGHLSENSKA